MTGSSAIQGPKEQATYLLFSTLAAAQQRSQQIASGVHCDGTNTVYWYSITALTNGQFAMHVDPPGYGVYDDKPGPTALGQLTPSEIAALVPWSTVQPNWPNPVLPGS
jgi:hypothetical protein